MHRAKYYKYMFLIGAFWNWIVAVTLWFTYKPFLVYLGQDPLRYAVPLQLALSLIFVYGIAYFYLYKDRVRNRQIAKIGIYGKTATFVLLTNAWLAGDIVFLLVIPGIVDLLFAVLFLEFLVSTSHFSLLAKVKKFHGVHDVIVHARAAMIHRNAHH